MRPVAIRKNLTAASVNCIAAAQTLAAAGNVVLNGGSVAAGVATLDTQRRVLITSDGNDTGITFTVTGARQSGQAVVETVTGASGAAAQTLNDFYNVGTVSASGAVANHVTIGTSGTGSTDWIMPNFHLAPFNVNIAESLTGTATFNLETTEDTNWWVPAIPSPIANVSTIQAGATVAAGQTLTAAVTGYRFTITSGTGTLAAQCTQAGIVNY